MIFSFRANFSKFYSETVGENLLKRELAITASSVDSLYTSVLLSSTDKYSDSEFKSKAEVLKIKLKAQIETAGDQGVGRLANEIIDSLNVLLGTKLTKPAGLPATQAYEYGLQIDNIVRAQTQIAESNNLTRVKKYQTVVDDYTASADSILGLNVENKVLNGKLNEGVSVYNKIRNLRGALGVKGMVPIMENKHKNIGKIEHSFKIAKNENLVDKEARFQAILQSLFFDLTAPLMLFILAFVNNFTYKKKNTPSVGKQSFPEFDKAVDTSPRLTSFENELDEISKRGTNN
jgi:hypothetical protein